MFKLSETATKEINIHNTCHVIVSNLSGAISSDLTQVTNDIKASCDQPHLREPRELRQLRSIHMQGY